MPKAVDYRTRVVSSFPNYNSEAPFDLAIFVHRLHSPQSIEKQEYLQVKTLIFHLLYDHMAASGIMTILDLKSPADIKEPPKSKRLPGDLGIAAGMCRQVLEAHHKNPNAVPVRKWWQIIVFLLRRCVNVETIEVPAEWWDVRWYPPRFPMIDPLSQRQLGNARWRWGEDPEGTVEVLEERSLQFE